MPIVGLLSLALGLFSQGAWGWDFSRHSIPGEEIRSGGPPRDAIPTLFDPKFLPAA